MSYFGDQMWENLARIGSLEMPQSLRVGIATVLLPLAAGLPLGGYATEDRKASHENDCLTVRALVIDSGGSTLVIVSYDLLYASVSLTNRLRAGVDADHGIPPDAILVCATHTHCAPRDITERTNATLTADLAAAGQRAVSDALCAMTPARAITASTSVPKVGANRRDRHSRMDDSANVVLFEALDDDNPCGRVIATLVNLTCHPVVLDDTIRIYHPDFVGYLREFVEHSVGGTCIFLQGFAGDTNPVVLSRTIADARRVGGLAAGPVIAKLNEMLCTARVATVYNLSEGSAVPVDIHGGELHSGPLSYVSTHVSVQQRTLPTKPSTRANSSAREAEEWISELFQNQDEVFNSMDMVASNTDDISIEVQSMAIGENLLIVGFPGEPFDESRQQLVAQLPGRQVLAVGYSNGSFGYLPPSGAYVKSGYEVGCSIVAPGTAEVLIATAVNQNSK